MGMPAQPGVGLIEGDLVTAGQRVGGCQTSDTATDDRNRASE